MDPFFLLQADVYLRSGCAFVADIEKKDLLLRIRVLECHQVLRPGGRTSLDLKESMPPSASASLTFFIKSGNCTNSRTRPFLGMDLMKRISNVHTNHTE